MALHPLRLPECAGELRRIVAMQRLLLKALCVNPMNAGMIDEAWLCRVWLTQEPSWIHKFCRKRKYSILEPIRALADATLNARRTLYAEFCRQSRVKRVFNAGGQFTDLAALDDFSATLAKQVNRLFVRFYKFLSHDTESAWDGYEFRRGRKLRLSGYKTSFDSTNRPEMTVCPYCDGTNEEPDLDHYYAKETFPLLSCSPWNLIPACHHCNKLGAKAANVALDLGTPCPSEKWLHPFFRPASRQTEIRLTGAPENSIPRLHTNDPTEQSRLSNHAKLIPTLSVRWTRMASVYLDNLVQEVNRKAGSDLSLKIGIVNTMRNDHLEMRGREGFSMIHVAVCQAILDRRPEYLEEFGNSNPPLLA